MRRVATAGTSIDPDAIASLFPAGETDLQIARAVLPEIAVALSRGMENANRQARQGESVRKIIQIGDMTIDVASNPLITIPPSQVALLESTLVETFNMAHWTDIGAGTRSILQSQILTSITSGENHGQMVARLRSDQGGAFSPQRARRIARTESTTSLNAGHAAVTDELVADPESPATGSEWNAIIDNVTRGTHRASNGKVKFGDGTAQAGWLLLSSGQPAAYPGEPRLPAKDRANCRCLSVISFLEKN